MGGGEIVFVAGCHLEENFQGDVYGPQGSVVVP